MKTAAAVIFSAVYLSGAGVIYYGQREAAGRVERAVDRAAAVAVESAGSAAVVEEVRGLRVYLMQQDLRAKAKAAFAAGDDKEGARLIQEAYDVPLALAAAADGGGKN